MGIGLIDQVAGGRGALGFAPIRRARGPTGPRVERPSTLSLFRARRGAGSGAGEKEGEAPPSPRITASKSRPPATTLCSVSPALNWKRRLKTENGLRGFRRSGQAAGRVV